MDAAVRGLGVRIRTNGRASYYLRTTDSRSKNVKLLLGETSNIRLEEVRKLAGIKLKELRESTEGTREATRKAQSMTFGKLAEEYLLGIEDRGRTATYLTDTRRMLEIYALPKLGSMPLLDIDGPALERVVRDLRRTGKIYQANRLRQALIGCWRLATRRGYLLSSAIAENIERSTEQPRKRVLSEAEVERLWYVIENSPTPGHQAARLILLTTSRRSEVLGARIEDFDLDRGVWIKTRTKTGRVAEVALSREARELVEKVAKGRTEGWLFPSTGKTGHLVEIKKAWNTALKLAEVPSATLHDLRRTAATRMLERGASVAAVMQAGNWSSPSVLLRNYAHVSVEVQREAAENIVPKRTPKVAEG
ncbi:hypothetical protein FJM51_19665 [Amaricoccus solimangrovi]|uniref:Tyr recombinase domain-containing protein n=2 Tax=Amaricoccus solimangrovi TaxID=2589815 RepID=A0A501WHG1_9RHOB|nr:hypothetical protein FJM51_19665 [Amaricoccus solimangrovi]